MHDQHRHRASAERARRSIELHRFLFDSWRRLRPRRAGAAGRFITIIDVQPAHAPHDAGPQAGIPWMRAWSTTPCARCRRQVSLVFRPGAALLHARGQHDPGARPVVGRDGHLDLGSGWRSATDPLDVGSKQAVTFGSSRMAERSSGSFSKTNGAFAPAALAREKSSAGSRCGTGQKTSGWEALRRYRGSRVVGRARPFPRSPRPPRRPTYQSAPPTSAALRQRRSSRTTVRMAPLASGQRDIPDDRLRSSGGIDLDRPAARSRYADAVCGAPRRTSAIAMMSAPCAVT